MGYNSNLILILDDVPCGLLKSFKGGNPFGEVAVTLQDSSSNFSKKHISRIVYEGFDIEIDLSMNRTIYYWITAFWNGNHTQRNGRIIMFNDDMSQIKEFEFFEATMTEVSIPSPEIQENKSQTIKMKISQQHSRFHDRLNSLKLEDLRRIFDMFNERRRSHITLDKQIIPSKFRLAINGLDCSGIIRIDSLTTKLLDQHGSPFSFSDANATGVYRKENLTPKVHFPNVKITLSESTSSSWSDWFEDFLVHGHNADNNEKNGYLVFLTPDLKEEILRINLRHLGIFRLSSSYKEGSDESDENANLVERNGFVETELYCEQMEFQVN